ncbi:MAG TPA: VOC family protein [Usitatibacter sp.]|nr:VOC family protein [Usitatibacter sp.]
MATRKAKKSAARPKARARKPASKATARKAVKKAAPRKAVPKAKAKAKPRGHIRGVHTMFYSSQAEELRRFIRDMLQLPATDMGQGWLIFDLPEADMGVHPIEGPMAQGPMPPSGTAHISFYTDDLASAMRELQARGVEFASEVMDQGWGLVTKLRVPGGFEVDLYEPKYKK